MTETPGEKETGGFPRIILHVDMDAFFAAVEVQKDPSLRGRPVIVGADPKGGTGRGVVSTASYEARTFGVHSAMPIRRAFERCPHGVYLRPDFDRYLAVSAVVMETARGMADRFEQVSIDEAYLDISRAGSFDAARGIARALKELILERTGLTCSVGIGPSKVVAKIASDYRKPDGLTVVEPCLVDEFLFPLPAGKIPGIGRKSQEALRNLGITTIGDLARIDVQELQAIFGKWGAGIHDLARGIDDREVIGDGTAKSVSREITFEEDTGDVGLLAETLDSMAEELQAVLQQEHLRFRTVTVKVRDENFSTHTRSKTFGRYCDDGRILQEAAHTLLKSSGIRGKVRLIGLRVSGFEPPGSRQATISEFYR